MAESLIALGCVGVLGGLSVLVMAFSPLTLAYAALAMCGGGMLLGVPLGVMYHLALRRELVRTGELPARWYLSPQRLHARLAPAARRRVLPWFYAGGAGFALIVLGMMLSVVSLVVQFR